MCFSYYSCEPVSGTVPLPPAVVAAGNSRLGLEDSAILVVEEKTACSLNPANMKILWVVNSENYIYKRDSLNRARKVRNKT